MTIRHMILVVCSAMLALTVPVLAMAEDEVKATQDDRLQIGIVGDVMAQGLSQAIARQLSTMENLKIVQHNYAKGSSGFVRDDYYDWNAALPAILEAQKFDYILVFLGSNDRQSIRVAGKNYKAKTPTWREEYIKRIDQFLNGLQASEAKIIWLGQPISRGRSFSSDMALFNEIYRQYVESHGGVFFDVWNLFANEKGKYSRSGPDVSGQIKNLRASNGIHFTKRGYDKLAFQILKLIEGAENGEGVDLDATDEGELVEERYNLSGDDGTDMIVVKRVEEDLSRLKDMPVNVNNVFADEQDDLLINAPKVENILDENVETTALWKKVLEDGIIIEPEFGRSDDFSWPRN